VTAGRAGGGPAAAEGGGERHYKGRENLEQFRMTERLACVSGINLYSLCTYTTWSTIWSDQKMRTMQFVLNNVCYMSLQKDELITILYT
jgi:hypothetical protein